MKTEKRKLLRTITVCSVAANVIVLSALGYMLSVEKKSDRDFLAAKSPVYVHVPKSPAESATNITAKQTLNTN